MNDINAVLASDDFTATVDNTASEEEANKIF